MFWIGYSHARYPADLAPNEFDPETLGLAEKRLYVVADDIAHKTRWRRVFRRMQGYGA